MLINPSVQFDGEVPAVSRKRKHPQLVTSIEIDDTKRILIAKEDGKLVLLREITVNLVSIGNVLQLLPEMFQNQATIINLLHNNRFHSLLQADFQRISPLVMYHNPQSLII